MSNTQDESSTVTSGPSDSKKLSDAQRRKRKAEQQLKTRKSSRFMCSYFNVKELDTDDETDQGETDDESGNSNTCLEEDFVTIGIICPEYVSDIGIGVRTSLYNFRSFLFLFSY